MGATPSEIVLTFDQPAVAMGTRVVVTGPSGPVQTGTARLVDDTVTRAVAGGAPAGAYTVAWRVTSADGHPVSGTFTFTSTSAGAQSPPVAAAPAPAEPAAGEGGAAGRRGRRRRRPVLGAAAVAVVLVRRRRATGSTGW